MKTESEALYQQSPDDALSNTNRIIEDNRNSHGSDFIPYEQRIKAQRFNEPNAITSADDAITSADDAIPSTNEDLLNIIREYKQNNQPVKKEMSRRQFSLIFFAIACVWSLLMELIK